MLLATKIKDLRKKKLMTQEELAKEMDVSVMSVAFWETNRATPSPRNIKKLAFVLECPIETFTKLLERRK